MDGAELAQTLIATGVGTLLGFGLTRLSIADERKHQAKQRAEDRAYAEDQRALERQREAAGVLDRELIEIGPSIPTGVKRHEQALEDLHVSQQQLQAALDRARILRDPSVLRCAEALKQLMFIGWMDSQTDRDAEQHYYPLGIAFEDLRNSLAAFINGEAPFEGRLPVESELRALAFPGEGGNRGLEGVRLWLADNPH